MNTSKAFWEARLSKFGLSEHQIAEAQIIAVSNDNTFAYAHDPDFKQKWWKQNTVRMRYAFEDNAKLHRIPVRRIRRQVPEWATSNPKLREICLKIYPQLGEEMRPDGVLCNGNSVVRRRAALMMAVAYFAWRLLVPNQDIAEELGISKSHVEKRLERLKKAANDIACKFGNGLDIRGAGAARLPGLLLFGCRIRRTEEQCNQPVTRPLMRNRRFSSAN